MDCESHCLERRFEAKPGSPVFLCWCGCQGVTRGTPASTPPPDQQSQGLTEEPWRRMRSVSREYEQSREQGGLLLRCLKASQSLLKKKKKTLDLKLHFYLFPLCVHERIHAYTPQHCVEVRGHFRVNALFLQSGFQRSNSAHQTLLRQLLTC